MSRAAGQVRAASVGHNQTLPGIRPSWSHRPGEAVPNSCDTAPSLLRPHARIRAPHSPARCSHSATAAISATAPRTAARATPAAGRRRRRPGRAKSPSPRSRPPGRRRPRSGSRRRVPLDHDDPLFEARSRTDRRRAAAHRVRTATAAPAAMAVRDRSETPSYRSNTSPPPRTARRWDPPAARRVSDGQRRSGGSPRLRQTWLSHHRAGRRSPEGEKSR